MQVKRRSAAAFFSIALCHLFLIGCGGSKIGSVDGTLTLDGQPVPTAVVMFIKQGGGELKVEGAVVQDGKFTAKLPPGNYRLEVKGQKVVSTRVQKGFDGKDEVIPQTGEMFPNKYHKNSTLAQDIKAGANVVKLDLNSMP